MESKTSELPLIKKISIVPKRVHVAPGSSCCTPKDDAAVCCTPSKTQEENNGSCCSQPEDGSACCNK